MGRRAQVSLAAAGVFVLTVGLYFTTLRRGRPSFPDVGFDISSSIDRTSLTSCGGCHADVWREWNASLHAKAWTNANVRAATKDFAMTECRACHSPMASLGDVTKAPEYRAFNRDDGVHCLSCHGLPGGVAAAHEVPDAPCRPRRVAEFGSFMSCNPCHQPTHNAIAEYKTSRAFATGVQCVNCHMTQVTRVSPDGRTRPGRFHGACGGLNPDFARRGVRWSAAIEHGELVVTLRNQTGHKFPGEIPSRVFVVKVVFDDGTRESIVLRKPNKGETNWPDNRLTPDEVRGLRWPFPAGAKRVDVRVLFKPFPLMPDDDAFDFGAWSGRR